MVIQVYGSRTVQNQMFPYDAQVDIRTIDFWGFPRSDLRGVFVRARRRAITVPLAALAHTAPRCLPCGTANPATAPATIACSCRS
jgi:hypothetical protein